MRQAVFDTVTLIEILDLKMQKSMPILKLLLDISNDLQSSQNVDIEIEVKYVRKCENNFD